MPVYLRRFYSKQLLSIKELEKKATEEASKSSTNPGQNTFRS